jgi:hypothetical protein
MSERTRRYTTHATLGTAAQKILSGELDVSRLDEMIARCAWCQFDRSNSECWHYAARVLLEQGLRPVVRSLPPVTRRLTLDGTRAVVDKGSTTSTVALSTGELEYLEWLRERDSQEPSS